MKGRILVIDDEESIRDIIREILTANGYEVVCCSNGRDGLSIALKERFEAIITDMVMPGMQGAGFIALLRQSGSNTPIIAMTGCLEGDEMLGAAKDFCVDCVLFKPFKIRDVPRAVERVLENRVYGPISGRC